MLNPTWPKEINQNLKGIYVLPKKYQNNVLTANASFETGKELRLQSVYTYEIEKKLNGLGIPLEDLEGKKILEICSGTGFLSFHVFKLINDADYIINDIAQSELECAQNLLKCHYKDKDFVFLLEDMNELKIENEFDFIIGNSFLHHLTDVGDSIERLMKLLKPGGAFISLHEPTPTATIVESKWFFLYPLLLFMPKIYNEIIRKRSSVKRSDTDLWLFDIKLFYRMCKLRNLNAVKIYRTGILRPMTIERFKLHLSAVKTNLAYREIRLLKNAIWFDDVLQKFLPNNFFGSFSVCIRKSK